VTAGATFWSLARDEPQNLNQNTAARGRPNAPAWPRDRGLAYTALRHLQSRWRFLPLLRRPAQTRAGTRRPGRPDRYPGQVDGFVYSCFFRQRHRIAFVEPLGARGAEVRDPVYRNLLDRCRGAGREVSVQQDSASRHIMGKPDSSTSEFELVRITETTAHHLSDLHRLRLLGGYRGVLQGDDPPSSMHLFNN